MKDLVYAILRGDAVDWPYADADSETTFVATVEQYGLESLIAQQLHASGQTRTWPRHITESLSRFATDRAVIELARQQEIIGVLDALASADVRPLLLKGTGLAYTVYPHPRFRDRYDTDLLVRHADFPTVSRIMGEIGYARVNQVAGTLVTHQQCLRRIDRHGVPHVFDVHWKISNPYVFANLMNFEELQAHAVAVRALGAHARTLDTVRALLLACIHRVAHHNESDEPAWLYDIHLLARHLNAKSIGEFAALATAKGVKAVCAQGLYAARERLDTPLPPNLLMALANGTKEASGTFLGGHQRRIDVLLADLHALPGWRYRLRLLYEHVFPPAPYMLETYNTSRRAVLPALYVHRFLRGVTGWFRTIER